MYKVQSIDDFPKFAGIYKFTNSVNKKVYIGETQNLKKRMGKYRHFRKDGRVHLISRAFQKYGFNSFKYEILETFPIGTSKQILLEREEFWIKIFDSTDKTKGYNILKKGRNTISDKNFVRKGSYGMLGKKMSDEAKARLSKSNSGENNWNYGKRGELHPNWGRKRDKSSFKNVIIANSGPHFHSRKPIYQIDPITNEIIKEWSGIIEATEFFFKDKRKMGINNALKRKHLSAGFKWEYSPSKGVDFKPEDKPQK